MIDISAIQLAIKNNNAESLALLMKENKLQLINNRIVAAAEDIKETYEYLDKRQLVRKILLNSALTTPGALIQ